MKKDKKLILVIPPKIRSYLDWKAENTKQHKAEIVRNSILASSNFTEFINHCEDTRDFIDNYQKSNIL